jgi:DnaJ-class molecular chaperone
MSNFYNVLGIKENSSPSEIKSAYRGLSMEYHPDRPNGDEEKFKKISEAYETLSDPDKRQMYDINRNNPFMRGGNMHGMPNEADLLNMLFGGMGGVGGGMGPLGGLAGMAGFPMGMQHGGTRPTVHIFRGGQQMPINTALQKPVPIVKKILITLAQAYAGCTIPIEIERWVMQSNQTKVVEREKIYVEIPKGIDTNEIIVVKKKGNVINDNNKGDIKVFVKIQNNSEFRRNGLDLIYTKTITLKEALIGFKFDVNFINGKTYTITSGGKVIKPNYEDINVNMGMKRGDMFGNLVIRFLVEFPASLTAEQKKHIEEAL